MCSAQAGITTDTAGTLCSPMPSSRAVGMTDSAQQKATDKLLGLGWSCTARVATAIIHTTE